MYTNTDASKSLDRYSRSNGIDQIFGRLFICALFFALGAGAYHIALERGVVKLPGNVSGVVVDKEGVTLEQKLSKLIWVDSTEKPSVATIVDSEKLKKTNPIFYENAEDGDKLVVYSNKAVIYREKDNLIVNILAVKRENAPSITPQVTSSN